MIMSAECSDLIERHLAAVISELLQEEPVIVLTGARTVGKSTLLAARATAHGVGVVDLDEVATRRAVTADPGPSPQHQSCSRRRRMGKQCRT
jgi:predicted AAA+ superfamily ATPase